MGSTDAEGSAAGRGGQDDDRPAQQGTGRGRDSLRVVDGLLQGDQKGAAGRPPDGRLELEGPLEDELFGPADTAQVGGRAGVAILALEPGGRGRERERPG